MSTRKIKRVIIALLAVTMLVVSSAFVASAAASATKTYYAGNGYFIAKMTSDTNGMTSTVVTASFTTSNGTGVTTKTSSRFDHNYAGGLLNSLAYVGSPIYIKNSMVSEQIWTSGIGYTTYWYPYS